MRCFGAPAGAPMLDGPRFPLPVPRLASPRAAVPAGSVAVAGRQAVVSARQAPGGWCVIGRTPRTLVDVDRDPPAAFAPGDTFRFFPIRGRRVVRLRGAARCVTTARVQVVEPGLSTVQDLGRADGPRSGQMAGGALDQYSARMANTLVASDPDAALLELVALDFAATTDADLLVAVTGADADVTVDGHPQPQWEPVVWRAGTRLAVRRIRSGLRVYLAVHGTLHTRRLLGSCAPDTVLGFGAPLGAGAVLTVAVDCPPVVQPWFDIPFFRLGARPHRLLRPLERRPDRRPGRRRVRRDRGAAHRRRLRRRRPQQPHRAAPRPRRPRAAARPRGRDRGAVPGVPVGAVEVPDGDELLVLHRGPRRHRGLPGARRRHQRRAVPPRAGPPRRHRPLPPRHRAPPRSRTTGASRPTSPRSGPASSTVYHQPRNHHCISRTGTSQIGTAIHTARPPPHRPQPPGVSMTTSHPPTAGLPQHDPSPNARTSPRSWPRAASASSSSCTTTASSPSWPARWPSSSSA